MQAANDAFERAPSSETRAALTAAFSAHARCLSPVIGPAAAIRYAAAWTAYLAAIGTEEEAAARDVFDRARVAVGAALESAQARDKEPDENEPVMMEQEDRWTALAASSDALQVALVAWMAAATVQTLGALDDAARQYTVGLTAVIGRRAAERHAVALRDYQRATEHLAALRATLAVVPSVTAEDATFLEQVISDQAAAGRAYEAAGADVVAAVEQARERAKGV